MDRPEAYKGTEPYIFIRYSYLSDIARVMLVDGMLSKGEQ